MPLIDQLISDLFIIRLLKLSIGIRETLQIDSPFRERGLGKPLNLSSKLPFLEQFDIVEKPLKIWKLSKKDGILCFETV